MSLVEEVYQEFKQRNDITKVINGKLYYRIVYSEYFNITGTDQSILSIVPSPDMPKIADCVYQDENGNHFIFKRMHHIHFINEIPEWYFDCGECSMEWQETKNIGKYLSIVE